MDNKPKGFIIEVLHSIIIILILVFLIKSI